MDIRQHSVWVHSNVYMCVKEVKILWLVRAVGRCLTMGHTGGGGSYCSPEMGGLGLEDQGYKNLFQSSTQRKALSPSLSPSSTFLSFIPSLLTGRELNYSDTWLPNKKLVRKTESSALKMTIWEYKTSWVKRQERQRRETLLLHPLLY